MLVRLTDEVTQDFTRYQSLQCTLRLCFLAGAGPRVVACIFILGSVQRVLLGGTRCTYSISTNLATCYGNRMFAVQYCHHGPFLDVTAARVFLTQRAVLADVLASGTPKRDGLMS